jgi:5-(carboxyamino)imidazole ribonucleotide synthase
MTAAAVAMVNLLGDLWEGGEPDWAGVLDDVDAKLHLYGKSAARPGRKMGHLTAPVGVAGEALRGRGPWTGSLRSHGQPPNWSRW